MRSIKMSFRGLAIISALFFVSCHSNDHEAESEEKGHGHGDDEIVMSPADAARFGVSVQAVTSKPFSAAIKVIGEVLPSTADQAIVTAPTSGVVSFVKGITQGKTVKAGEAIASISAKNMSGGDANETARIALQAAKRELDRITPLVADGIVTKKDYNDALQAYENAKAAYSSRAAGGAATSPISGVINAVSVSDGQYVEAGAPIASVARSTRLTLKALLPQREVSFLPLIQSATILADESPVSLSDYNGRLLSNSSCAATETPGYIPVYFSFDNPGVVIPGAPVEVYLIGNETAEVLSVPVEALSEQMGEKFVYVKIDDHGYKKQPVTVGQSDGRKVEIKSGLASGDSVVVAGTTFVRLAETSTVVPEGHSHSH